MADYILHFYYFHLVPKSGAVRALNLIAVATFLACALGLWLGTYFRWYKDRQLTLRRYMFPPYVLWLPEPLIWIYGYLSGAFFLWFAVIVFYGLVL